MTPALQTYLRGRSIVVFAAVQFSLPGATVRLLDGAGQATFAAGTFVGRDPIYGALAGLEELEEALGTSAPRTRCLVNPPDTASLALWTAPAVQGSEVRIWAGGIDESTGAAIAEPELLFVGEIDVPTIRLGENDRAVEIEVMSAWERMFADDEGFRLNDAFHQSIWPGELGMRYVTGVERHLYWGAKAPIGTGVTTYPRSSSGGGGGEAPRSAEPFRRSTF